MKTKKLLCQLLIFGFLLGIYEGKVAIWSDSRKEPLRVFPYSASQLPEKDRNRLAAGIRFNNLSDLKDFIEDYLS